MTTPKALFVNTHVLATACGYFRSSAPFLFFGDHLLKILTAFDLTDGIVTSLAAGFPPDAEPIFDMEEQDLDSDYDDPVDGDPAISQLPDMIVSVLPERSVKAYIVKYTAYKTFVGDSWSLRCVLMGGT